MVKDMSNVHARMPQRRSLNGTAEQAAVLVDLAKLVVTVEFFNCSQLAAPSVREEKRHIVKVRAYCW